MDINLFQMVEYVFSGTILVFGVLLALGLTPASKRIPKTHPLNRRLGLGMILLAIGYISIPVTNWLDLSPDLSVLRSIVLLLGIIAACAGIWVSVSTFGKMHRYEPESPEASQ